MTTTTHDQKVTHSYVVRYPAHEPRADDPHYIDFEHYRRKTHVDAKCVIGAERNDYTECDGPLELHHAHVEFALQNGIDLAWLEVDYPGISNRDQVGAWVESAANLKWLCLRHHRGDNGVHILSSADFEAQRYVRNLIGSKE